MTFSTMWKSETREASDISKSTGVFASVLFSICLCFALSCSLFLNFANLAWAQSSEPKPVTISSIKSGLNGTWKVGFDTSHQIELLANEAGQYGVELETVDGDGVRLIYRSESWVQSFSAGDRKSFEVLAKHGRPQHPIHLRVVRISQVASLNADESESEPIQTKSQASELLLNHELTPEERGTGIASDQPWVVGIGSKSMMLDSAMLRSARSNIGDYAVTELHQLGDLPRHSKAYSGVDLLVFSSSNQSLLQEMTDTQAEAIRVWVWHGGRTWLTLGGGAADWVKHSALAMLVPGKLEAVADQCNPGPLESFLNSQSRLAPYSSAIFDLPSASVELNGQQVDRTRYPLVARWSVGAGKVRMLATEIDSPAIKDWDSQVALVKLMLSDAWEGRGVQQRTLSLADDLSVQMSQMLDRFAGLQMASLAQLCTILFLLLCILGPIDYFLVAKKWRLPRGTWLTLITTSLVACVGIAVVQSKWKPKVSSLNSLEFIDIDAATGTYSGHAYSHFYGGPRGLYEFSNSLENDSIVKGSPVQLNWLGQPGRGLGGFESTVATDRSLPIYTIDVAEPVRLVNESMRRSEAGVSNADSEAKGLQSSTDGNAERLLAAPKIHKLGIPESGTKGFEANWEGQLLDSQSFGRIASHAGAIDLLDGEILNPLPDEIHNGILIYRGRFYTLPLRFRSGDSFSMNVSVVPKDFTRRLQKRINIDGKDQGTPWDRNEQDLARLAEMFSFHRSAAGMTYTGLIHRYMSRLDLSEAMKTERAVLLGEIKKPQIRWDVHRNGDALEVNDGARTTIVRVLLPVDPPPSRHVKENQSEAH